jgi:hypothetical protein
VCGYVFALVYHLQVPGDACDMRRHMRDWPDSHLTFNKPARLRKKNAAALHPRLHVLSLWMLLQVSGDARAMRRQMRDRALAGLDKLEVLQRSALSGGPMPAPSLAGDLPAPSEAGAPPGTEDGDFQYQPTKVSSTSRLKQKTWHQPTGRGPCLTAQEPNKAHRAYNMEAEGVVWRV